ncbi:uncharacterized protein LTR77_006306 [Saxophila tyrrhenica]|uniref:Uncharacterized protein n=1 Tax=Saxophila tyrrhenica TaxID=1690608 RepID=A0AAV9PAK0_9PEZI|nr:hypothetical protein LTR77_006306 [Saxophila tyrrhenica]
MADNEQQRPIEDRRTVDSPAQDDENEDDDAPMVHTTPSDHATWAPKEVERLRSEGKEAMLMREIPSQIPREEGESGADYAKRFSEYMNNLIRRGVSIMDDQITHNAAPNQFTIGEHEFDVGPHSGITKREYREFGDYLFSEGATYDGIPERFLKFEVPKGTEVIYYQTAMIPTQRANKPSRLHLQSLGDFVVKVTIDFSF